MEENADKKNTTARLLISCADRPGIVAAVSNFLYSHGANITALDQHSTDPEDGSFFMRLQFHTPHLDLSKSALESSFVEVVASRFDMNWRLRYTVPYPRTAILVSKYDHALMEILWRWREQQLPTQIVMVISNHPDLRQAVESFDLPFYHVPVDKESKSESEAKMLELMQGQVDVVILARYMQIITPHVISQYPNRMINIHHSFLPAFAGAKPYHQAYERGVKLIGATAHYVTEELDAGPIIEQDVSRVTHRHNVRHLLQLGRDLERQVLARALQWHLEDRVMVHGNKTIVFGTS